jgi:transcription elongation factor Elf1
MESQRTDMTIVKQWDSAHKCPQCGHVLKLADIDLKVAMTGIVVCLNCDRSGPIEIQIIERIRPAEQSQARLKALAA